MRTAFPDKRHVPGVALILAIAAVLYALAVAAYYVGFFNDDAFFIIGSRALLEGRFVELNDPLRPPLVHYPPGYPLLLAAITFFRPDSFLPYQALSVVLSLATIIVVWMALRRMSPAIVSLGAVALTAFNPLTVSLSGAVLSDVAFTAGLWVSIVAAHRIWRRSDAAPWAMFGLGGAFLFLVRPVGAVVPLSATLLLLLERRWRPAGACAAAAALAALPYVVRNWAIRGVPMEIGREYVEGYAGKSSFAAVALAVENAGWYVRVFFTRYLFRWPVDAFRFWADGLSMVAGLIGVAAGVRAWWRADERARFALVTLALYAAVHLLWARRVERYLLPVLPLLYALFLSGVAALLARRPRGRTAGVAVSVIVALALFLPPLRAIVRASQVKLGPPSVPPKATYSWIRAETAPDALFATEYDGRLHLLTGRFAVHLPSDLRPDALADWLEARGVDYVLGSPTPFAPGTASAHPRYRPVRIDTLAAALSGRYEPAFQSPHEKTIVWRRGRRANPVSDDGDDRNRPE